jgi:hypothetical protein
MLQAPLTLRRLTALATRLGCQISIGRKSAGLWRDGAATFASCVGSQGPILCEASLFMRHVGAAFLGNFASLIDIHVGETTPSNNSLWGHWSTLCVQSLCGTESGADVSGTRRLAADDQQFHEYNPSGKTPTFSDCDPDDSSDSRLIRIVPVRESGLLRIAPA